MAIFPSSSGSWDEAGPGDLHWCGVLFFPSSLSLFSSYRSPSSLSVCLNLTYDLDRSTKENRTCYFRLFFSPGVTYILDDLGGPSELAFIPLPLSSPLPHLCINS